MFVALKRGFRRMASLILVRNVVGELQRTLAASRGFLAAARLSCSITDKLKTTFTVLAAVRSSAN